MELSALSLAIAVATASLAMSSSPSAQTLEPAPLVFRVGDLDTAGPAGAAVALRRIKAAAAATCGPAPTSVRGLKYRGQHRYCVRSNMDAAIAALGAPRVTELYGRSMRTRVADVR